MRKLCAAFIATCVVPSLLGAPAGQGKSKPAQEKSGARVKPSLLNPASLKAKAPEIYKVKFATTKGAFVVQVTRAWAPLGADRFYNLVKNGFYDGASFFRVVPGFVVQFGINAKPEVSKTWQTATIKDDPVIESNKHGYLSFATAGPNTRTTQVFINLADNSRLDKMGFSSLGEVAEGMDVVDQLYSGYGEGAPRGSGPEQDRIQKEGKAYLDRDFPKLDSIKSAVVLSQPRPSSSQPRRSSHLQVSRFRRLYRFRAPVSTNRW